MDRFVIKRDVDATLAPTPPKAVSEARAAAAAAAAAVANPLETPPATPAPLSAPADVLETPADPATDAKPAKAKRAKGPLAGVTALVSHGDKAAETALGERLVALGAKVRRFFFLLVFARSRRTHSCSSAWANL